ncbi:MAG: efflux RND transporter permease subunit [Bacteroidales bacterium]|nr:efflux RND transporter permease subunit [Bacteroidales bacterium]
MVRFLIKRPVAVIMTFLAVVVLGIVASGRLPVSLMPDIEVPEITVAISRPDISSREIENSIVSVLRRSLIQVEGVGDIRSEARNGSAIIRMKFAFRTDVDLAFMEVNEKIDAAMNMLPGDLERPRIIKASATDIPVFMLNITMADTAMGEAGFAELSDFAGSIIRKRIEQLPEVALADMTGQVKKEIYIRPDELKMRSLGISATDICNAVSVNNINIGSIMVKEGKYIYNLEFDSNLKGVDDIRNIWIRREGRMLQIKDFSEVGVREVRPRGVCYSGNRQAVALAIIKEASSRMRDLEQKMTEMTEHFRKEYPRMRFEISQDQTRLLDYSLKNLRQSLLSGGLLAFFIMFFFLKDARSPLIIGFSIPATLIISLLFFYLVGLSINVISLSGLILGIGMMIDNSIVIIENITQWIDKGESLVDACVKGTNEVITPLISSVLTTCAVFVPLIFLSGISGALFYDQAIAIIIGQGVSLIVGIGLLPTVYYLMYRSGREGAITRFVKRISLKHLEERYENGMNFFFRYRRPVMITFMLIIGLMVWLFSNMKKEKFPEVRQDELAVTIDWNENIDLKENTSRVNALVTALGGAALQTNSFIGEQQFIFNRDYDQPYSSAKIYVMAAGYKARSEIEGILSEYVPSLYPEATVTIKPQENIFEKIFTASETPLVVEVALAMEKEVPPVDRMMGVISVLAHNWPDAGIMPPALEEKIEIRLDPVRMLLYDVDPAAVYPSIRSALNRNEIGELRSSHEILPIVVTGNEVHIGEQMATGFIINKQGAMVPLKEISVVRRVRYYKAIIGNVTSEYVPVNMDISTNRPAQLTREIENTFSSDKNLSLSFSGALITGQRLFRELAIVLLVSLMLLYFILAAQFESLTQPLIVLLEIPIDIAGALLLVKLWGGTINVMTMIGLIVMSGVIINDSILKVDTINNLRRAGMGLKEAIYAGGSRRLKPIIMVAMASIFSTIPMLFGTGLGNELQRPMALALIGGMSIGTVVSLFFIPLAYWFIYRRTEE